MSRVSGLPRSLGVLPPGVERLGRLCWLSFAGVTLYGGTRAERVLLLLGALRNVPGLILVGQGGRVE